MHVYLESNWRQNQTTRCIPCLLALISNNKYLWYNKLAYEQQTTHCIYIHTHAKKYICMYLSLCSDIDAYVTIIRTSAFWVNEIRIYELINNEILCVAYNNCTVWAARRNRWSQQQQHKVYLGAMCQTETVNERQQHVRRVCVRVCVCEHAKTGVVPLFENDVINNSWKNKRNMKTKQHTNNLDRFTAHARCFTIVAWFSYSGWRRMSKDFSFGKEVSFTFEKTLNKKMEQT